MGGGAPPPGARAASERRPSVAQAASLMEASAAHCVCVCVYRSGFGGFDAFTRRGSSREALKKGRQEGPVLTTATSLLTTPSSRKKRRSGTRRSSPGRRAPPGLRFSMFHIKLCDLSTSSTTLFSPCAQFSDLVRPTWNCTSKSAHGWPKSAEAAKEWSSPSPICPKRPTL